MLRPAQNARRVVETPERAPPRGGVTLLGAEGGDEDLGAVESRSVSVNVVGAAWANR